MKIEDAIDLAINEHDCKYAEELMHKIYDDFEMQQKANNKADYKIGAWVSAALDDPNVCAEFKADIEFWFSTKYNLKTVM